jgi:Undecaprenyl-phosphate glucose phosphotransferase
VFFFMALLAFLFKLNGELSRGAVLTFFFVGLVAVAAARAQLPRIAAAMYDSRQLAGENVLLVGAQNHAAVDALKREVNAIGCASVTQFTLRADANERDWRRELDAALARILISARVTGYGQICVCGAGFPAERLAALLAGLQQIPRAIRLVPEPEIERLLHMPIRQVGRQRAIELQRAPLNRPQRAMKRAIDLALAIPLTLLLSPLFAALAIAIVIESKGPAVFRQERLGLGGRPVTIFKFRSMRVVENGANVAQATKNDARVTNIGRFLRKTSIDELPQLLNVILGTMSLVGPRPHALAHDQLYATLIDNYELRQHVKPGITGWAQVNGYRGETADVGLMRARVEHDVWYAKNASIFLDLQILVRTVIEVLRARNAY